MTRLSLKGRCRWPLSTPRMTFPSPACALVSSLSTGDGCPNLGDASSKGLRSLAAPKVDQVETAAATKEGGSGRSGRVEAATKFVL